MWLARAPDLRLWNPRASKSKTLLAKGYSSSQSLVAGYHEPSSSGHAGRDGVARGRRVLARTREGSVENRESLEEEMSHFEIVAEF